MTWGKKITSRVIHQTEIMQKMTELLSTIEVESIKRDIEQLTGLVSKFPESEDSCLQLHSASIQAATAWYGSKEAEDRSGLALVIISTSTSRVNQKISGSLGTSIIIIN